MNGSEQLVERVANSEVLAELIPDDQALIGQPSPFQIKNMLVPMDFLGCAQKVLRYAVRLAEQNAAAITLLHVLPGYVTGG